ncbi:hypothetical protein KHC33_13920 [Methanospirillum sp. J.3.6.1-F.2.7.3]|uniref:Uncharacterized protein n=1 Tax=Methanospirillum purgamenti TaxID=2834276 RepID=A0A8E7EGQ0_9EURY|nr:MULTISPECIES: hypothetical protein [Methanospirillum]MDX8551266.1 hypothetical protein [Methanospirillum hungatei]QVV88408.1 hypothetical protein KHC33_13920 [Methanospirillum sp. J.3.6.1-F.2.7.3]
MPPEDPLTLPFIDLQSDNNVNSIGPDFAPSYHVPLMILPDIVPVIFPSFRGYIPFTELPDWVREIAPPKNCGAPGHDPVHEHPTVFFDDLEIS